MRKKMLENEESDENEVDDPSEVEELQNNGTDDDWSPAPENKRRTSGRAKSNKRSYEDEESSELSEDAEEGGGGGGGGGGRGKKKGAAGGGGRGARGGGRGRGARGGGAKPGPKRSKAAVVEEEEEEDDGGDTSSESESGDTPSEFKSGAYVVLKTDFKAGGEHPIWKIDGKSLLQKYIYEKENEDGEPSYKGTTIYAGWSKSSKESYYPITVETKQQKGKDHIVTFNRSQVKVEEEN